MADDIKYCPHCGAKLVDEADYCFKCGKRLTVEKEVRRFAPGDKLRKILTILTFLAWVVSASLLISSLSISRVDYDCGGFLPEPSCEPRSIAEINVGHAGNLFVLLISFVALYIVYRLWFSRKSVSTLRVVLAILATFIAGFYSVGFAYAGEQKNDHAILSAVDKACFKTRGIDYYIDNGTYNCGPRVDARMNVRLDEIGADHNDSVGTVAVVCIIYTALISAIVLLPPKRSRKRSQYSIKH